MKCNMAKTTEKPVGLWLTVSFDENTTANLPDDFGKSWEKI
jgi:hypothetical protein